MTEELMWLSREAIDSEQPRQAGTEGRRRAPSWDRVASNEFRLNKT